MPAPIQVQEALAILESSVQILPSESIDLEQSTNRVLRQEIIADRPFPPFDRVTMDGIAIRWEEGREHWTCIGRQCAGEAPEVLSDPGQCLEIMTGAVLPCGADTVIPVEAIKREGQLMRLLNGAPDLPAAGSWVHPAASDCEEGRVLISPGRQVDAGIRAICATVGCHRIVVSRLPVVALLTSGDEIIPPDRDPAAHQFRRSNDQLIKTELHKCGVSPRWDEHLPDNPAKTLQALKQHAGSCDLVISSGGVSKGTTDHLPHCLEEAGYTLLFHRLLQQPGAPLLAAFHPEGTWLLGLPGNPLSTLVCARIYLRKVLERMTGYPLNIETIALPSLPAFTAGPKTRWLPVTQPHCQDSSWKAMMPNTSGDLLTLLHSTGCVRIAPGSDAKQSLSALEYYSWTR